MGNDQERPWSLNALSAQFRMICIQGRIGSLGAHVLRHTFASRLVMAGVDLSTVRELIGHNDIQMTLRDAHLSPHHKRSAMETLEARFSAPSPAYFHNTPLPRMPVKWENRQQRKELATGRQCGRALY